MNRMLAIILFASGIGTAASDDRVKESRSNHMTLALLHEVIQDSGTDVQRQNGIIQFRYDESPMLCMCDPEHDRMRIISPVIALKDVETGQMAKMMEANFHTALDARYATSNEIVYAAYIHPLSSLTREMVSSAIKQVSSLRNTFGSYYHSGVLSFPNK